MSDAPTLSLDSTIARSNAPLAAKLKDDTVLMSLERGNYYCVSDTAEDIWEKLASPTRIGDLCAMLAREYGADEGQVIAETMPFLNQLAAEGLIEIQPA
jgi:hypothetical protein